MLKSAWLRRSITRVFVLALLVPVTAPWLGCGTPQLVPPDSLEVIFLPLDGAINVNLDVEPRVYLSDDVKESSVTKDSVFLESANLTLNGEKNVYKCEAPWNSVDGKPGIDAGNPRMVVFHPDWLLAPDTCYRLILTTAVRGVTRGPMEDMRKPGRPGVGAEGIFSTGSNTGRSCPFVRITSPEDGAVFDAPVNIEISADAFDSNGTVAVVEFFEGTNKLGEDDAEPFEITWSNVFGGDYTLTAKATDNDGLTGESKPVQIKVISQGRVADGILVLYTFEEGSGITVRDVSGAGDALDLTIIHAGAVDWVEGGLEVKSETIIQSSGPATKLIDACKDSHEMTVEAWIKPANTNQHGNIVTVSGDISHRNFTMQQWSDSFEMMLRTTRTSDNGSRMSSGMDTATVGLTHVVYVREGSGTTRIYVDNVEGRSRTVDGDFSNWDESYLFALANEFEEGIFTMPWLGVFYLVAVYDRPLGRIEVAQNYNAGP